MKKYIIFMVAFIFVSSLVSVTGGRTNDEVIPVYAADGRVEHIVSDDAEAYYSVGWYANIDDVSKIMISPEGTEERIFADYYSYYLSLGYIVKNVRNIDPSKPMVALTYDDGPSVHTNRILNCLQLNGVAATFFEVGNNVARYPQITKRAYDAGMEIGNHSYSHPNFNKLSVSGALNEIASASGAISNATGGYVPKLIRPPYGNISAALCSNLQMPSIHWSIDTLDWKTRNTWNTVSSVLNNVKDGDIILMHDVYSQTAEATEIIVPALIERGFQLVTVSELSLYKNKPLVAGIKYHSIR